MTAPSVHTKDGKSGAVYPAPQYTVFVLLKAVRQDQLLLFPNRLCVLVGAKET
jgi:hypothetical protein